MLTDFDLIRGKCEKILPTLQADSIDSVVTDPPYALNFMGKNWDTAKVAFAPATWQAVLRVLKPGAYLLAFGGTRTYHRLVCAIEDAGFEIRDCLQWMYGSGFPKGKGCLKPSHEPIVLAQKPGPRVLPLPGLEECRVGTTVETWPATRRESCGNQYRGLGGTQYEAKTVQTGEPPAGRYPPNLVLTHSATCRRVGTKKVRGHNGYPNGPGGSSCQLSQKGQATTRKEPWEGYADADGLETVEAWECADECPVRLLGEQSGEGKSSSRRGMRSGKKAGCLGEFAGQADVIMGHNDEGTCARFFPQFSWSAADDVPFLYCPKADGEERDGNDHPTMKPVTLMCWLVRLITPKGGLCLDPFAGSGTTGVACLRERCHFLGIEKKRSYHEKALARLQKERRWHKRHPTLFDRS